MRTILVTAVAMVLLVSAAMAQAPAFGVGAFGGMSLPLLQDDQGSGNVFGVRARLGLLSGIQFEPYFAITQWGDPDPVDGVELGSGSKVTAFGVDATLGFIPGKPGLKPFLVVGVGSFKIKNDDTGYDQSKLGFNGGIGFGFGVSPMFDIDVRGVAMIAPQEAGSKKALGITAGLTYYFGVK